MKKIASTLITLITLSGISFAHFSMEKTSLAGKTATVKPQSGKSSTALFKVKRKPVIYGARKDSETSFYLSNSRQQEIVGFSLERTIPRAPFKLE